ncbi:hypothetical protein [Virgibacillus siamensis]|uniref:hypothetical protein n=1 Tax=Virgibacillus siamensis TaxID=480071 RepID=UPI0009863716|nr:hypothetical protein [Virgibacillus siamensis]
MRETKKGIERGQSITFRVPSDTPDYLLKQLQKLKETERRNFSSEIAKFVLRGVNETYAKKKETLTIPLPKQLTKEQKSWLKHEHSEAMIGTILYQLLQNPMRATSILASLNGDAPVMEMPVYTEEETAAAQEESDSSMNLDDVDLDDMGDIHVPEEEETEEEPEEENPLGDFFSRMNK